MSENRRKFIRIDAGNAPCHVTIGQTRSKAVLVNEAIYGLCIGGLDLMFLALDQHVVIEYESERIPGRCRSATKDDRGMFQIGVLKSDDEPLNEFSQILINSYMDFGGCKIVCIPVKMLSDAQVRIRLLDGKEFTVPRSKVFQLTRLERLKELEDDLEGLGKLLRVYAALTDERPWSSEQDILDQEFGPTYHALVGA